MYPFSNIATSTVEIAILELSNLLCKELAFAIQNRSECCAISKQLLCYYFQVESADFILNPLLKIVPAMQKKLLDAINRLKKHEPLQYIIGEAYFAGNLFKVTPDVLIPRPETEEWVTFLMHYVSNPVSILDIGTGSGCIAITLKQQFPQAVVEAVDISKKALAVASYNAKQLGVEVHFIAMDILTEQLPPGNLSLIVSNPPYIRMQEKSLMHPNVLHYEPHLALFVDDADPFLFYKRIIQLAFHRLGPNGILCLEINEALGKNIVDLLDRASFKQITLHKDLHEKERWVMAML
ncbi:peptide chain release factor N(5)-glutamine methyltransferase [Candidatus Cardinium hertigii]|jgi:release factor glutamine methyltransferase|uniref:peptide chain release factor N(5)-glutamine methyltransferase n=1 Tax=Candidatus Cardinium hertigii TaxID=247481 RepID=A0A3N2QBR2_9BACT|nr:peptide chain release factor N(5)-glutamine methyltransferase [Candidatus Cardinium hertigii]ROT47089.1 peptide chain release factor N(5)-glutamine methyltransferase [Candidatus Cardinium hertigii]